MKIVYLHQYYITPQEAGGTRSYYQAQKLGELVESVVVITSNTKNSDWPFVKTVMHGKVKVVYIKNLYSSDMSKWRKIVSFVRFMILSTWYCLREKQVDRVFASSTPLSIGVPALAMHYLKSVPYVFELRDLWPDVPRDMGYIKSTMVFRMLKAFERLIYKKAEALVTISEGIKDYIDPEFKSKTHVFTFG